MTGVILSLEAAERPMVVVFSRKDPVSQLIAFVATSWFTRISHHGFLNDGLKGGYYDFYGDKQLDEYTVKPRKHASPILFINDSGEKSLGKTIMLNKKYIHVSASVQTEEPQFEPPKTIKSYSDGIIVDARKIQYENNR